MDEYKELAEGRYLMKRILGQGGFGTTFLAVDQNTHQEVVVKEFRPEDKKAVREARTLAALRPVAQIAQVMDCFTEKNIMYIVMEYVRGTSLRTYLECLDAPLRFVEARDLLLPVMDALDTVHKKHLLHRDLSPDNLLMREDGSLCVIDFGSARPYSEDDRTRTVILKKGYAPPEQYAKHGRQRPWTDVYGLCAVLYEMITGTAPQDALSRMDQDCLYPPSMYGAEITEEQEQALLKGLALDYRERYATMSELKAALAPAEKPEVKRKGRSRYIVIMGAAALLLAAVAGFFRQQAGERESEVVYAGNYDRGSERAEEYLVFVRSHAVSSGTDEESGETVYTLAEKDVEEYGLPCNRFRFTQTKEELEALFDVNGWDFDGEKKETVCNVRVGEYGRTITNFSQTTEYRGADNMTVMVEYDLVNEDILECTVRYPREEISDVRKKIGDLFLFLIGEEASLAIYDEIAERSEKLKDMQGDQIFLTLDREGVRMWFSLEEDGETVEVIIEPEEAWSSYSNSAYWP